MNAPVAIVGAGPVGMVMALLLDQHGVVCRLFDSETAPRASPRGSTHNARTMELYRQLGLATAVRQLGLPGDYPTDVRYLTRLDGFELARLAMPSERDKQRAVAASSMLDQVPEPVLRANQMMVERYLAACIRGRPHIDYRAGWQVEQFSQHASGVAIRARHASLGTREFAASYLVGCDGARSLVRKELGIALRGPDGIGEQYFGGGMLATHLRAPTLYRGCLRDRPAFQYWVGNPELRATLIALDGRGEFLMFTQRPQTDGPIDRAWLLDTIQRCIGHAAPVEVLDTRTWRAGAALVAESLRERRVFLAGDAAHLFTPTGGFGMNTGIEDAANLAWKLTAVLQGWGGEALLASYELERLPVARRNAMAARELSRRVGELRIAPDLEDDTPEGAARRAELGSRLAGFADQFDSMGVHLGARVDGSPIIIGDAAPPAEDLLRYTPSGVPGGRAPHFWLDRGRGSGSSLYDRCGTGFTLLRFEDAGRDADQIVHAAALLGIPLEVVDIPNREPQALYQASMVLIRPDRLIAWRGSGHVEAWRAVSILRRLAGFTAY
ncbi:FAD-dependent monooxygenase [Burkholderia gladioli]|uniref:FAD-dependent monooxygenase n=1 Tax=Burkholderia gladioli TaxID=28095 RepID=UPI0003A86B67|nr:FAD-dependent monooxygenase [Burkholderia gladioli]